MHSFLEYSFPKVRFLVKVMYMHLTLWSVLEKFFYKYGTNLHFPNSILKCLFPH